MTTATLTARTRTLVQDTGRPFAANVMIDGISTVFDLPVESISSTVFPPTVVLDGLVISGQATEPYYIDYKHGIIAFYVAPGPAGAILGIQGSTYDFFTDDEVALAVNDAFNLHVADQYPLPVIDPVFGQPTLDSNEQYCVSILAAIELLWFRSTDSSQQIDIHTPEGVFIPRAERFQQMMSQIQALQDEYKSIAGTLGVGLWRIQILWQRRVSYTTNRFVPLYQEQEYNAPYTGFEPTAGAPGTPINIYGEYFTGTTSVTFGGVPATQYVVVSDTQITASVPVGAVTGQIGIITPGGVVLSTAQFVVGQPAPFVLYGPEQVLPPIPPGT